MKNLIFSLFLCATNQVMAMGHDQGNGGVGVLCQNSSGQKQVQIFDLFEGKVLPPQLTPIVTGSDYNEVASRVISKFSDLFKDPFLSSQLKQKLAEIVQSLIMLPSEIGLDLTDDVGQFIKPKNCELVQIINYRNDGQVYVDSELLNLLDVTHKAAALVHETIYWYLRQVSTQVDRQTGQVTINEVDSSRVRKIVAYLFSDQKLETLGTESGGITGNRIKCDNHEDKMGVSLGNTEFVLFSEQGRMKARFIKITGQLMISRSEAVFDEDDGLQGLRLNSLIAKGISFEFFGIPDLDKLKNNGKLSVVIKDETRALEYQSTFQCYGYNY